MSEAWSRELSRQRQECERELRRLLRETRGVPAELRRAMAHSLFGGGKRLRPLLAVWCCDALTAGCSGGAPWPCGPAPRWR